MYHHHLGLDYRRFCCFAYANLNARLQAQLDPFPENNRYADVWGEGNYAYQASYNGSGVMIIDIIDPAKPVLVGSYDTYPDPVVTGYDGNWGRLPISWI